MRPCEVEKSVVAAPLGVPMADLLSYDSLPGSRASAELGWNAASSGFSLNLKLKELCSQPVCLSERQTYKRGEAVCVE